MRASRSHTSTGSSVRRRSARTASAASGLPIHERPSLSQNSTEPPTSSRTEMRSGDQSRNGTPFRSTSISPTPSSLSRSRSRSISDVVGLTPLVAGRSFTRLPRRLPAELRLVPNPRPNAPKRSSLAEPKPGLRPSGTACKTPLPATRPDSAPLRWISLGDWRSPVQIRAPRQEKPSPKRGFRLPDIRPVRGCGRPVLTAAREHRRRYDSSPVLDARRTLGRVHRRVADARKQAPQLRLPQSLVPLHERSRLLFLGVARSRASERTVPQSALSRWRSLIRRRGGRVWSFDQYET